MTNEVQLIIKFQMQASSPKRNIQELYRPPPPQDSSSNYRRLILVIIIATIFIAIEVIGGKIAHSIAIMSDAIHLVSDLLGFVFSFVFLYLSKKEMDKKVSFGYHRMELIGALLNIFIVWAMVLFIMYEATQRIIKKQFVAKPAIMLITAIAGLVINILLYNILHSGGHSHSLMSGEHDHSHSHSDHSHSDGYSSDDEKEECGEECKDVTCNKTVRQSHCHKKSDKRVHRHENDVKGFSHHPISDQISGQLKEVCVENHAHTQNCYLKSEAGSRKHICDGKHDHNHEGHKHEHHDHEHHDHEHHDHQHHDHDHHDHHDHNDPNQKDKKIDHESIGMKSALFHALSDLIQSLGVVVSALIIYFFGSNNGAEVTEWNTFHLFDPIATYIFSILSLLATLPVIKNCYYLILESVPDHVDLDNLRTEFQAIQGVIDVHDIHVWDLKPGKTIVIAHVFAKKDTQRYVLTRLTDLCRKKRIYHSTFQVQQQQLKNDNDYILCHHDIH